MAGAADDEPSLAPQWLKGGGGGLGAGSSASRIVKSSPAAEEGLGAARQGAVAEIKSPTGRVRGSGAKGGRPAGIKAGGSGNGAISRVLPPEPFPRKRAPDDSRGWGNSGPVTTPRSATAAGSGSAAFTSFDRNGGGGGFRSNGRVSGGDAVSPRHAAAPAHGVPAGSPHHPSPRFGGSWGHGNGNGAAFGGSAFRSQSTPDAHANGGGGSGGWDRNGDVVRSALVSPTKGAKKASAGEAWTSRLVEPPAALPPIQTGAKDADAAGPETPVPAVRSDYLNAAVQSKTEASAETDYDAERSRREALSLAQSKLLVPVVSPPQKDRPRAKLKGPPPPAAPAAVLRKSPPPGGAASLPATALVRTRSLPADEGSRTPAVLGVKGRVLSPPIATPTPATPGAAAGAAPAERAIASSAAAPAADVGGANKALLGRSGPPPGFGPPAAQPAAVTAEAAGLRPAPLANGTASAQPASPAVGGSGAGPTVGGHPTSGNGVSSPANGAASPERSPLKGRNSFLRSLRMRTAEGGDGATAPSPTDASAPAALSAMAAVPSSLAKPASGSLSDAVAAKLAASHLASNGTNAPAGANGHLTGSHPAGGDPRDGVLGLPAEEEAFLRSLGWSEGAGEGGLTDAEIAAYRVRHSFAVR